MSDAAGTPLAHFGRIGQVVYHVVEVRPLLGPVCRAVQALTHEETVQMLGPRWQEVPEYTSEAALKAALLAAQ